MLFVTNLTRAALLPLYFTYNPRSIFQFFLTFLQINVIKMFTVRFLFTSGYFLRAPDNSNFFQFPLKVRVIGSRLHITVI